MLGYAQGAGRILGSPGFGLFEIGPVFYRVISSTGRTTQDTFTDPTPQTDFGFRVGFGYRTASKPSIELYFGFNSNLTAGDDYFWNVADYQFRLNELTLGLGIGFGSFKRVAVKKPRFPAGKEDTTL